MDAQFSGEQELLRESVRDVLARECPMGRVREWMNDPQGVPEQFWKRIAELGWLGLIFPEEYGGAGLSLLDLTVVLEEMGRALAPGPFFSSVVLGGLAVQLGGSPEQKQRILPRTAAGSLRATVAQLEEDQRWDAQGIRLRAHRDGKGFCLSGSKLLVPDAHVADLLVVAARTDEPEAGVTLFLVETERPGLTIRPMAFLDATRRFCEVRFSDVRVDGDAVLGKCGDGWRTLEQLLDHAKVALCAEMCGGAERVLELSVSYAKSREQFGRPIGTFQAIQHKCADMLVWIESAKSATYYAAWALAGGEPDAHVAACMAKAYCSEAYSKVGAEGIQIHGGLGFTWEQDLHLYFRRAQTSAALFGDAAWNREEIARSLLDRPAG